MPLHKIGLSQAWNAPDETPDETGAATVWVRSFGRPGGLEETDRVLLVAEGASVVAEFTLNGIRLGSSAASPSRSEFDVTSLLRPRNELLVVPSGGRCPPARPGRDSSTRGERRPLWRPLGDVSLEIVSADDPTIA